LASKHEVERHLEDLLTRLGDADGTVHASLSNALPDARVIEVTFPDIDASYWTTVAGGTMDGVHPGPCDQAPDIRLRMDSDQLIDMVEGRKSFVSSFLTGQVKVDAGLSDLLRLRRLA
jgi:hypothetical protein